MSNAAKNFDILDQFKHLT